MDHKAGGRQTGTGAGHAAGDHLAAELEAYNRAFAELELPWRWDVDTFRQLLSVAGERDCVGAYIERNQPHLLRAYEKTFLRDLVLDARDRCRAEAARSAFTRAAAP
jgi:hypothetical protein